jgi:hypothetical protein
MTKKKRRKRPVPLRPPEAESAGSRATSQRGSAKTAARSAERPRRPRTPEERRAAAEQWAHPPLAVSVARALRVVGSSPVLVVSSFLATLVLWLIFTTYGASPAPSAMVLMTALPPAHSLLDIEAVITGGGSSPVASLLFLAGLLVLRAGLISLWVAASVERLKRPARLDRPTAADHHGSDELSMALRRAARSFGAVMGVEAGFYVLSMTIALIALVSSIGQIAVIAVLVGGLLFFIFVPIAAVAEGVGLGLAVRLSIEAARLPGPRHMLATVAYVAMTLTVSLFAPTSRVAAATPSITTWLFVLFVTFLHVTALATFAYRWLVVRDRVIQGPVDQAGGKRERPAPAAFR